MSPTLHTSPTLRTYSSESSLMWHRPSLPGMISMNAPKSFTLVTRPSYTRPTCTDAVIASTLFNAFCAPSASLLAIVTVPSSSTSITAPVDSWIARIILPPGPMSAPIFSGSILRAQQPRRPCRNFGPRARDRREHLAENLDPRFARLSERRPDDFFADAVDLQIELNAGDAVLRAGDFEIHVAEMIFIADDVGQQHPLRSRILSPVRPRCPPRDCVIFTPAAISPSVAPQTEAIELEPFDSKMSEITRIV